MNPDNPYRQQVFAHWELLNQLAQRRFAKRGDSAPSPLAEEATLYVLNQLEADDWLRIRQYRGQSSFRTFLALTAQRLLEDFWRQKYGRARAPAWIKVLGPLWEYAYQKLCRERWSPAAVMEALRTNFAADREPQLLEDVIAAIRGKVIHCGAIPPDQVEQRMADLPESFNEATGIDTAAQTPATEKAVIAEQRAHLLKVLAEWLDRQNTVKAEAMSEPSSFTTALKTRLEQLTLTAEERLLLRLIYQEGLNATAAGQRLGFNTNQTHGRLRRVLERIHVAMKEAGFDQDALKEEPD